MISQVARESSGLDFVVLEVHTFAALLERKGLGNGLPVWSET